MTTTKKALVQDDQQMFSSPIVLMLKSLGFGVEVSTNGIEGLEKLKAGGFDVIFTDVEMPNMNGFEFLGRVKKDPKHAATPVVMCTTLNKPEHIQFAKKLGATSYVVKPLTKDGLEAVLKQLKLI